jgi:hypothetical protein
MVTCIIILLIPVSGGDSLLAALPLSQTGKVRRLYCWLI